MNRTPFYILLIVLFIFAPFVGQKSKEIRGAPTKESTDIVPSAIKNNVVQVLQSDANTLVFQVKVPPFTRITKGSGEFRDQINIPDFSQSADPGKPQLPVKGFPFGIPEDAEPTFTVIDKEVETYSDFYIHPAPTMVKKEEQPPNDELFTTPDFDVTYELIKDEAAYNANRFYPEQIVRLNESAFLRDQRLQAVRVFPVQYNPVTKQIRYIKNITIQVNYNASLKKPQGAVTDDAESFEKLYQRTLLNYDKAKQFRKRRQASLRKPAQDDYFLTEGDEWYKIFVEKDAIYWMERSDLAAAGLDVDTIDPRYIKMFNKGQEIDIHVHGQDDGSFDTGDYIEFYGTAFKNYYTDTNVYWLTVSDTQGSRMAVKDGTPSGTAPVLTRGKERVHFEEDVVMITSIPNSVNEDQWYWEVFAAPEVWETQSVLFNVSDTSANDCSFKLRVKGGSDPNIDPNHHIVVTIAPDSDPSDSYEIINYTFNDFNLDTRQVSFPQSAIKDTDNTIKFNNPGDTGASVDYTVLNFFEIEYWRDYLAMNDSLGFSSDTTGIVEYHIKDFSIDNLLVIDISDTTRPRIVNNFVTTLNTTLYNLSFQDDVSGPMRYVALSPSKREKPDSLFRDDSSDLRSISDHTDYLIIAFDDFYSSSLSFAEFKEQQGYDVKTFKVQNIYDEFNYGFYDDAPIQQFLEHAYNNWTLPRPSFVLLVGDGSKNPRIINPDRYGYGRSDFVPTHFFESIAYEFTAASDNWLACVNGGDILPDMHTGRITARTNNEAKKVFDKMKQYQTNALKEEWQSTTVFIADNGEQGMPFEANSDSLMKRMPTYFENKKVYLSEEGTSTAKSLIKQYFNEGAFVINYQGHGATRNWAQEGLFWTSDVPKLRNDIKNPVVVTEACTNGNFTEPQLAHSCLGEVLLNERNRGASAIFTGAGYSYLSPAQTCANEFYRSIFKEKVINIGDAKLNALMGINRDTPQYWDHVMFYTLFGDPSMEFPVRAAPHVVSSNYSGTITVAGQAVQKNTELLVYSNQKRIASTYTFDNKGSFGPLSIPPDNPETLKTDGAAPGDTLFFLAILAEKDTVSLHPTLLWQPGQSQQVNLKAISTNVFSRDSDILFFMNDQPWNDDISGFNIIAKNTNLSAHISNVPLNSNMEFRLNGKKLQQDNINIEINAAEKSINGLFVPKDLADGHYQLQVTLKREGNDEIIAEKSIAFSIQSDLQIEKVLNYPNPMQDRTYFTFSMRNDRNAAIKIKIFTVAGRLIDTIETHGHVGYNEYLWDGRDERGDLLANGVYFYKIIANDGDEKSESIKKLIIAR